MLAEIVKQRIECPACKAKFPRPSQAATATCESCGNSVTLIDQEIDRNLVFRGKMVTRGKIVVRAGGMVRGNLSATEIVVEGEAEGNLTAVEKVILKEKAKIRGAVTASSLSVAEGAALSAHLEIGK